MPPTMSLANLLNAAGVSPQLERGDMASCCVSDVRDDSREVEAGALFVARGGHDTTGARFIDDALARGAVAVLAAPGVEIPGDVAVMRSDDPSGVLPLLAQAFHGHPSRHLGLIGITGTNGKTTTATLLKQILDGAGVRTGLLGTVEVDDGRSCEPASLTTPAAAELAALLGRMVGNGCAATAMEVSSHALDQGRTSGIEFKVGIFTNLSGDHLDYHGTMDAYARAKARLFTGLGPEATAVVNLADPASRTMLEGCGAKVIGVRVGDESAEVEIPDGREVHVVVEEIDINGMTLRLTTPWGSGACRLALVGDHNAFNAGAAFAGAMGLGLDFDQVMSGLASVHPPRGRLQPVHEGEDDISVFVDYAHTDAAISNVLGAVRGVVPSGGRLRVVFGAGGDRDRTKRPRMLQAACAGADLVMVTSDNPRTEDPASIVREILAGAPEEDLERIDSEVDRAAAIERSILEATPGEVVVIAGKGHEDYQVVGTERRHFDDAEVATAALERRRRNEGGA